MKVPAVAIVIFPSSRPANPAEMRRLLEQAGEKYTRIPGLRRKYFIAGKDSAGGVYEWESRSAAEAFYDRDWYASMESLYGAMPSVQFFDSPAIADGIRQQLELYI